jgi:hypothetical protein
MIETRDAFARHLSLGPQDGAGYTQKARKIAFFVADALPSCATRPACFRVKREIDEAATTRRVAQPLLNRPVEPRT